MKIAVVGLGLFGSSLARKLARKGAEVLAIDANMDLVDDIKQDVALAVKLDATDERELRSQGVHEADVVVASIGDDFEANQLLVMLAKQIGVKRVAARAPSRVHARILRLVGADDVVMPEEEAAEEFARRLVQPSLHGYFELIEGYSVAEIDAPPQFHGHTLAELDLKKRFRVNLIAIKRPPQQDGQTPRINAVPQGTDRIEKGDVLAVAGADEDLKKLLGGEGL